MSTTLTDISKRSGLSYQTVADILSLRGRKRDRYARGTRQRVLALAEELGYRPNAAARAVATGRFQVVTLLMSVTPHLSYLPPGMLAGLLEALDERGYQMHFARMSDQQLLKPGVLPGVLRQASSDGLLLDYTHLVPGAIEREIEEHRIPAVWLNAARGVDCVRPDDEASAHALTRGLIERGHRRIDYVCLIDEIHYSCAARFAGYARAMREAGLSPRKLGTGVELPRAEHEALFAHHLAQPGRPTAVVTYSEYEFEGLYVAARMRGLGVPSDLTLATFVAESIDLRHMFPFVAMVMPDYALGRRAIDRLLSRIEGAPDGTPAEAIPARWAEFDPTRRTPPSKS